MGQPASHRLFLLAKAHGMQGMLDLLLTPCCAQQSITPILFLSWISNYTLNLSWLGVSHIFNILFYQILCPPFLICIVVTIFIKYLLINLSLTQKWTYRQSFFPLSFLSGCTNILFLKIHDLGFSSFSFLICSRYLPFLF